MEVNTADATTNQKNHEDRDERDAKARRCDEQDAKASGNPMRLCDNTTVNGGAQQEAKGCERGGVGGAEARSDNQQTKGCDNAKEQPTNRGARREAEADALAMLKQRVVMMTTTRLTWRQAHDAAIN